MARIERTLLLRLTRELRNSSGIERTPEQVESWVVAHAKQPHVFIRDVLKDPDATQQLAKRMKIKFLEDAPPSSEWE